MCLKHIKLISICGYIAALLFLSCNEHTQAIQKEDNIYNLSTEKQLIDKNYIEQIEAFYKTGKAGYFEGKAKISIFYKTFRHPQKESPAILISSGRTEAVIKYKELIFDLYNNGYSVYIHDHRGQGLSGRMTEDPDMGFIDTFQFYIDDMKYFYDNIISIENHSKKFLLAHSMGGAIGMTYLEQYPHDFNVAAFSSPMLGFNWPTCEATELLTGEKPEYALGQSKYNDDKLEFKNNILTGSEIRYNRMNAAFAKKPKAKLGGATYQWVHKSCLQFNTINEHIKDIETPFIIFSAGNESIVDAKAHQNFIDNAKILGKICDTYVVENAQHELLIESDEQRIETLNAILKYYNR